MNKNGKRFPIRMSNRRWNVVPLVISAALVPLINAADRPVSEKQLMSEQQMAAGNYRDAYDGFRTLLLGTATEAPRVATMLPSAIQCLDQLDRSDEVDELRESVVRLHPQPVVLHAAAVTLIDGQHYGFLIAGEFFRGNKRGDGQFVNTFDRDRVRALQWMRQAAALFEPPAVAADAALSGQGRAAFYDDLARMIVSGREGGDAWKLQELTDLEELPDYVPGHRFGFGRGFGVSSSRGAPVDGDGQPVFHTRPQDFASSKSDGQRWRWALEQIVHADPAREPTVRYGFAEFLLGQFGVQTAAIGRDPVDDSGTQSETGPWAVHTLNENETIARLATGIKRFELPDEFNHVAILRGVADGSNPETAERAIDRLISIFQNRRQYPRAAQMLTQAIDRFGAGADQQRQNMLAQIVGDWAEFGNADVFPAGSGAEVELRFRNATAVEFEAHRVRADQLLSDVRDYLKSAPPQLNHEQLQIDNIGYRLITGGNDKYLGERVASWSMKLEPRENHFDRNVTVTVPLQEPGVYLLTARLRDGNTSRIVIWVDDTVIVERPVASGTFYFVADAVTGKPVGSANVECFGYRQRRIQRNQYHVDFRNFAAATDAAGQIFPDRQQMDPDFTWVAIARTPTGRMAFLGFDRVWNGRAQDFEYRQTKVFSVTDRPVYRPSQSVHYKFWVREARFDGDGNRFANHEFKIRLMNGRGEQVFEKSVTTDEWGGLDGESELPADAVPGQYALQLTDATNRISGSAAFRVEEYRKPEFEVLIEAPDRPVMLGEKIPAVIRARYYFGAPVTEAKVHVKVERTPHSHRWYPRDRWDWLYQPGYWWFGRAWDWYPGARNWCCIAPIGWWPQRHDPPEIVLDDDFEIGPDGTVTIGIDTETAARLHSDTDHQYRITAEVIDASRRTVVGGGNVLVARQPFQVFAWASRGYYNAGDTVESHFRVQTLDGRAVQGSGKLTLLRISYDDTLKPVEREVESRELNPDENGDAEQKFVVPQAGQYRLSYRVTDDDGHTMEGGQLLLVRGPGFDGSHYRFDDIELVTEQREYKPGDTARLLISTNRQDATVLLFPRAENGIYARPEVITMSGQTAVHEIVVQQRDMPNFFVEAMTISNGRLHRESRQIAVPPHDRVANVEILPSAEEYFPGAPASVRIRLTTTDGKPFRGSTVVSVYDRSLDAIAGPAAPADIREFFWKVVRSHYPRGKSSLDRTFSNLLKRGETGMQNLGVFGSDRWDAGAGGLVGDAVPKMRMARGRAMEGGALEMADAMPMAATAAPGGGGSGGDIVEPVVRSEFADTAFWAGNVTTDVDGIATVAFDMPENLTSWRIRVWSLGDGTRVGQGESEVITTKNLIVRLQSPRFFMERDEVVLSANVHNYLESSKRVEVRLELDGDLLESLDDMVRHIDVAADGEGTVDWRVRVQQPGDALIRVKALTDEESDAVEQRFPVLVHGMLRTEAWAGAIRAGRQSATIDFVVPADRRVDETRLEVRYSPTLAGALVDALPYLTGSPHQTTEATLNRFLPTVIVQGILKRLNVDLDAVKRKRTNLNTQEIGDAAERAVQWKRTDYNPVFDSSEVDRLVRHGVQALTEMQLSDGGWGWFTGYGERSSAHMTAVIVRGLQQAEQNGVALVPDMLPRGIAWLENYQNRQLEMLRNAAARQEPNGDRKPVKSNADEMDALVFMVLTDAERANDDMRRFLFRDRTHLSVYAKALLGLALHRIGDGESLAAIMQNIDQFLVLDDANDTAFLKLPAGGWWHWYGNEVEANAMYLKLLSRVNPRDERGSRLVRYLLNNRRHATGWNNTRDTALAVEALADYLTASKELQPDTRVTLNIDGQDLKQVAINRDNLFNFDNVLLLTGDAIATGRHTLELKRTGEGPLYFNAYLSTFPLEDAIEPAGLEVNVQRKVYRLIRDDREGTVAGDEAQAVRQREERYRREPIGNAIELSSGDLLEVELTIESRNDYEYLLLEDCKVSGCEPIDQLSGYSNSGGMWVYRAFRDDRVAFYIRRIARGRHSLSYRIRAERPGRFSALPAQLSGVYAPELRANSDDYRLVVGDKKNAH